MTDLPTVSVLTYCPHPAAAYGSLLVFDSLRVGFPHARIEVFDNGSHPEVLPRIRQLAEAIGAKFQAMQSRHYCDHLRWLLLERESDCDSLVLVDPDVVFWQAVEAWEIGRALLAGRLIPTHQRGPLTVVERLHPSLLWVPSIRTLRARVKGIQAERYAWRAVSQRTGFLSGRPIFWDTLADLFSAFPSECSTFEAPHLDCYDHLFCGSHFSLMHLDRAFLATFGEWHRLAASGDVRPLRGIWRKQQEFFSGRLPSDAEVVAREHAVPTIIAAMREAQGWQGQAVADDGELLAAFRALAERVSAGNRPEAG